MKISDGISLDYNDSIVQVIKQNADTYLIFTSNGHCFELGISHDSKYNYVNKIF